MHTSPFYPFKSLDHKPQICFVVYLSYPVFVVFSHGEDSVSIPIPLNWAQRASTLLVVWYDVDACRRFFFLMYNEWMMQTFLNPRL